MKQNLKLFVGVVISSLILAYPFGLITKPLFPPFDSLFLVSDDVSLFFNGLFWVYLLLTPILFSAQIRNKKWSTVGWVAAPAFIISLVAGSRYFVWSVAFFVVGIVLTLIINHFRSRKSVPTISA